MSSPLISVIVPVFKAQNTIRKCLDSIINQTLSDWELVLVDDGSPDESGKICDEYAVRDSRINVIHKVNAGVSAARQTGLDAVRGDYVIYADPDDWVDPNMLEELYRIAIAEGADMVICDWIVEVGEKSIYRVQKPSSLQASAVLHNIFDGTLHGSCCNKLIRRSCINKYGAYFPEGINYCEDVCFNVQLLMNDIKVAYLNKAFYHYFQSSSSITNHYTFEVLQTQIRYVAFLESCLPESSFPVLATKESVKKSAFRNDVLSDKDFISLYPEIKVAHDCKWIMGLMYGLAFRGHLGEAKLLRKAYWLLHGKNDELIF